MSPPSYSDLGKDARGIFSKGYHFGSIELNANTTSEAGVCLSTGGSHCIESGKVSGNLETKYKCKEHGVTITEKWTTDNLLKTDLSVEDKLAKGLKLALSTSFAPNTGKKKGSLSATYKAAAATVNADSELVMSPVLKGAAVAEYKSVLLGCQLQYDTSKCKLTKNNFALGYAAKDFTLHGFCNDGSDFGVSMHQKLGKGIEGAAELGWTLNNSTNHFGIGAKYALDSHTSLRAKVNTKALVGLGFQHKLRDGITLTLSSLVDGQNLNSGGHKIGLALDLDA